MSSSIYTRTYQGRVVAFAECWGVTFCARGTSESQAVNNLETVMTAAHHARLARS